VKIKIPYEIFELRVALLELQQRSDFNAQVLDEALKSLELPTEKSEINKRAAEFQGISVLDLINSPNYETLVAECSHATLEKLIQTMKDDGGLKDIEAWAIFALSTDILK